MTLYLAKAPGGAILPELAPSGEAARSEIASSLRPTASAACRRIPCRYRQRGSRLAPP